jgi:hypothetical protein
MMAFGVKNNITHFFLDGRSGQGGLRQTLIYCKGESLERSKTMARILSMKILESLVSPL